MSVSGWHGQRTRRRRFDCTGNEYIAHATPAFTLSQIRLVKLFHRGELYPRHQRGLTVKWTAAALPCGSTQRRLYPPGASRSGCESEMVAMRPLRNQVRP